MILASHNSWSYLKPLKWWMRPFAFMAKCQSKTIKEQYEKYGVRCFDLRIRYYNGIPYIVHNNVQYCQLWLDQSETLAWLNTKNDVLIHIVHDVRKEEDYTYWAVKYFKEDCEALQKTYQNITFWGGQNLYNREYDYEFEYYPKQVIECYSSVCEPKIIDDWYPLIYAKQNNKKIYQQYPLDDDNSSMLMLDYVNIGQTKKRIS